MIRTIGLMVAVGALGAGCASMPAAQDTLEFAKTFYGQERTYKSLAITGASEIVLRGTNMEISVSNELQPLSMIPRDPGIASAVISGVKDTALMGLGIYTAGQTMNKLAGRPQVVETTKEVLVPVEGAK